MAEDVPTSACWFVDCEVRIPMRLSFVPVRDSNGGQLTETYAVDADAVLVHLASHRTDPTPVRWRVT